MTTKKQRNPVINKYIACIPWCFKLSLGMLVEGMLFSLGVRLVLWCMCWSQADHSLLQMLASLFIGGIADFAGVNFIIAPLWLSQILFTAKFQQKPVAKYLLIGLCFIVQVILLLTAVAEIVFWTEFEARFNFIAVDYLAYTTEVLNNIWQSYPMIPILLSIAAVSAGMTALLFRLTRKSEPQPCSIWRRLAFVLPLAVLTVLGWKFSLSYMSTIDIDNRYNHELRKNGVCSLANAFITNQLDYRTFYLTRPDQELDQLLRQELAEPQSQFLSETSLEMRRQITAIGEEKEWNVILILEESLSASFSSFFNPQEKNTRTPCLDALCKKGLVLKRFFASGTRTVRGIEAVMLSIPPTPGQSIVKRPDHGGLSSLGQLFQSHGYDCTFLYGGEAYFDNMQNFFKENGYKVVDHGSPEASPKTFENAWGSCDEDVFRWALNSADRSFEQQKKFHQFILTTSNHRPYTFPQGTIDAPQFHRSSAIKYSDYALDKFLQEAEKHPWFQNTLFVIVADHCHSTSGRYELPLNKYHIPALFYNPHLIQPQEIETVCSQIDIAPTIFGLLNWSYTSEFFGLNVLQMPPEKGRAFPGTFQGLGFLNGATGRLTTLQTNDRCSASIWETQPPFEEKECEIDDTDLARAISFYQGASSYYDKHRIGKRKK